MKGLLKSLGLVLFGIIIGVIILEIGLQLIPEEELMLLIARRPMRFQLYQTDPRIGWRLKPNVRMPYSHVGEFDLLVQTNSMGLNDFETSYEKPLDTFRVLLLGDSFAEGINVPINQGFPYLLEICLSEHYQSPVEVINSGTAYYATAEELFFLQQEGIKYDPDLVLVAFYVGNDIDAYAARESKDHWFDALGGFLIGQNETNTLQRTWIDWKHPGPLEDVSEFEAFLRQNSKIYFSVAHSNSKLGEWLNDVKQEVIEKWGPAATQPEEKATASDFHNDLELMMYSSDFPHGPNIPPKLVEAWTIIDQLFSEMQVTTTRTGADLGVLIIPEKGQTSERHFRDKYNEYSSKYGLALLDIDWDYAAPNSALANLLAKKDISTLDLLPVFREYDIDHDDYLYFEVDSHLNEAGHQITAQTACQWVIEQNYIK